MPGQTRFPMGFGCDPTCASGRDLTIVARRPLPALRDPASRPGDVLDALLASRRPLASRMGEIEAQRSSPAPAGMASALWSSAAIGLVLAGSLYFLNYF